MFKTRYRICRDAYCGYEVQRKRWWFPVWIMIGANTHATVEDAEQYALRQRRDVVKELDI